MTEKPDHQNQRAIPAARSFAAQPVIINGALFHVWPRTSTAEVLENPLIAEARVGGCCAQIAFAQRDIERFIRIFLPFAQWSDFAKESWRDLLLALLRMQAEAGLSVPLWSYEVDVIGCVNGEADDQSFSFWVSTAGQQIPIRLGGDTEMKALIASAIREWPAVKASDGYSTLLRACAGHACIALSEFRTLTPGDVVLLDANSENPEQRIFILGESRWATWVRGQGDLALGHFQPCAHTSMERYLMTQNATRKALEPIHAATDIGDLEIPLIFEAGRTTIRLADLESLSEGTLIELAYVPDQIEILHGRTLIGTGRLVSAAGRSGVQIIKLFSR